MGKFQLLRRGESMPWRHRSLFFLREKRLKQQFLGKDLA